MGCISLGWFILSSQSGLLVPSPPCGAWQGWPDSAPCSPSPLGLLGHWQHVFLVRGGVSLNQLWEGGALAMPRTCTFSSLPPASIHRGSLPLPGPAAMASVLDAKRTFMPLHGPAPGHWRSLCGPGMLDPTFPPLFLLLPRTTYDAGPRASLSLLRQVFLALAPATTRIEGIPPHCPPVSKHSPLAQCIVMTCLSPPSPWL